MTIDTGLQQMDEQIIVVPQAYIQNENKKN